MELGQIAVIVPAKNECKNIHAFLGSLPERVSLIVADASDDDTPQIIAAERPRRTRVIPHLSDISEARQVGAWAATTPWLLFTDADIVFAPDYFAHLVRVRESDVIYGGKRSRGDYGLCYRLFVLGQRVLQFLGFPAASGSSLIMSREAFVAAGGFELELSCNEDSEIVFAAQRADCSIRFVPELTVYERDHRRLQRGMLRKTVHSFARCALLYTGLMPKRWRSGDWGYWSKKQRSLTDRAL